jgi:hypothetical protein
MPKSALIAGSSGLVGSHCLHFLLSSPEYASVTALVRRPSGVTHPKLHEKIVDFDKLENLPHTNDVFCALGTTIKKAGSKPEFRRVDFEYPLRTRRAFACRQSATVCPRFFGGSKCELRQFLFTHQRTNRRGAVRAAFRRLTHFPPQFLIRKAKRGPPRRAHWNGAWQVYEFCNRWWFAEVSSDQR